jgi:Carboxypeptidase regulatory-like domain
MRLLSLFLLASCTLLAQGNAVVFGTVTDESGSSLPQAEVTATNEATGAKESVKSNAVGNYIFPDLRPGTYKITSQIAGFGTIERPGVVVEVERRVRVDLSMRVGEVKQVLQVAGSATTVDTLTSAIKDTVDSKRMDDLPLNGRNALQLQGVLPGAIQMGSGSAASGIALNTSTVFSVNGTRPSQSAYVLDGGLNMDMYNNVPAAFPNPDALQEFSILQNSYSAVNGRDAGAVVTMVTKSGTNQLHGVLYDFLRNSDFDARNFFSPGVSPLHRNQFGGNAGGPVRLPRYNGHDRTFFFFAYEATRQALGQTSSSTVVPSALERLGNFSQSLLKGKPITVAPPSTVTAQNPNGVPYPGNIIPASALDPVAVNFTKAFIPLPNSPGNIYAYNLSVPTRDNQVVAKIDHSFSNANKFSFRYFWDDYFNVTNYSLPDFNGTLDWVTHNFTANDTHIFTPSLINVATLTIARNIFYRSPEVTSPANWSALGCTPTCVPLAPPSIPTDWILGISGGLGLSIATNYRSFMMNYQFVDSLTWTKGNHLLTFGGDIAKVRRNGRENFDTDPSFSFNGLQTGSYGYGYADFYSGAAYSVYQNSPISSWQYKYTPFLYFEDDWRVTHKLTLNFGVRWEPYVPVEDKYGENTAFRPGQQSAVYPLAPLGYLFPGDKGINGLGVVPVRWDRFSPRFGFAYDPFGDGKTSIRGGYGIFSDTVQLVTLNSNPTSQPFSYGLTTYNVQLSNPYGANSQPLQFLETYQRASSVQQQATKIFFLPLPIMNMNPDFTSAYVQQWNFNVQREVWRKFVITAAYLGNKGTHLHVSEQQNPGIYTAGISTTTNIDSRRVYSGYQTIESIQSTANSTYHALQLNWNRRFEGGLTVLGSYVFSKAIDQESTDGNSGLGSQSSDPFNWSTDKGLANFNVRHRFLTSFIWQLPIFRGSHGLTKAMLGGWAMNGILTLQTGIPFSVTAGVDRSLSGVGLDRADVVGPVATYNALSNNSKVAQYFSTSAFAQPALGTFGTSGRDILTGPGLENFDTGLFKDFRVTESRRFQIRWEVFNSLNRPPFQNPTASLSSSNFGRITTAGNPRIMQLAAKFYF